MNTIRGEGVNPVGGIGCYVGYRAEVYSLRYCPKRMNYLIDVLAGADYGSGHISLTPKIVADAQTSGPAADRRRQLGRYPARQRAYRRFAFPLADRRR